MARAVAAAVLIGLIAATAYADPPPGSSPEDRRLYWADQLIDQASKRVERDRACRFRPPEQGPVAAAPSSLFLNSLAALRRPARPDENVAFPTPNPRYSPSLYGGYTRVLKAADGTAFQVFPLHDISRSSPRPKRCVTRLRERVRRAATDRSRAFKRELKRLLRQTIASDWAPHQREGLLFFVDGSGAGYDVATFRRRGAYVLEAGFDTPDAIVRGVVPDGVASIDFTFRRLEPTGYWSRHHPVTYRTTVAVHDNVLSFHVPLTLRDAALSDQTWRAVDGHVIRVVRG